MGRLTGSDVRDRARGMLGDEPVAQLESLFAAAGLSWEGIAHALRRGMPSIAADGPDREKVILAFVRGYLAGTRDALGRRLREMEAQVRDAEADEGIAR